MDAFAAALSAKAGFELAAIYDPTDAGGATRLEQAGLGIVSLPFFLAHEHALGLRARFDVVRKGRPELERWVLVAHKGRVHDAQALAGFAIVSSVAFAPAFVRGALADLGSVPANVELKQSSGVLSALHGAAAGEPIAVLLDGPEAAALSSLAFASELEIVARSPAMPVALVVTTKHVTERDWSAVASALLALPTDPDATAALDGIQVAKFTPVDDAALAAARAAYAKGTK